jgi:hypothetical protein
MTLITTGSRAGGANFRTFQDWLQGLATGPGAKWFCPGVLFDRRMPSGLEKGQWRG